MSKDDRLLLERTQDLIQRTFIKSRLSDIGERWIEIHSRSRDLRASGDLSDACASLKTAFQRTTFTPTIRKIIEYRNSAWQQSDFQGKPERKMGRPSINLVKTLLATRE